MKIVKIDLRNGSIVEDEATEQHREPQIKIVSGNFYEGEKVTVEVCGKQFTRRVKFSAHKWGDLYITINNNEITLTEITNPEQFEDTDYAELCGIK